MKQFSITDLRLPGIRGFLKRNPMFRITPDQSSPSVRELVEAAKEALRGGKFLPGDEFPVPEMITRATGASLFDSLEAVTYLLKSGSIHQDPRGRLIVAVNEQYTTSRHLDH